MKSIKHELQNIIFGNEQTGNTSQLKKAQNFLKGNAPTGSSFEKSKPLKNEEESRLIQFAVKENLLYTHTISEKNFVAQGAEQRVYRYGDWHVIKLNNSIFYRCWFDYLNSLLIHNYFFSATAYDLAGFKVMHEKLYAVVKQEFIEATEPTDLSRVKQFLEYNHFTNTRNNDYFNQHLGIIFEDLHDENVLSRNGILYFIDTVFYLTKEFYEQ
ncbi:MAG: hypothetical protein KIS94_06030 [Chitinophagales bacterium]|nr:hypothetical protein [Chitinophagales bacterium]